MKLNRTIAWTLLLCASVAVAKNKKSDVPALFSNARFVYVEAVDGDAFKPGLYPDDRAAIVDMEDALREWGRYSLTTRRDQAELVFVVRKGRLASGQMRGGISVGQPLPGQGPARSPGAGGPGSGSQDPLGNGREAGTSAEVGSPDDLLEVYALNPDGKKIGPIWNRSQSDGLEAPQMPLFTQLKLAVERAYPPAAPSQPSKP